MIIALLSGFVPIGVFIYGWLFGILPAGFTVVGLVFLLISISYLALHLKANISIGRLNAKEAVLLGLIVLFMLVNIIGVFSPEVGFDALWYHLTIPKLYLQQGSISYIPGGLYYYSAMPKLTEMWYLISLLSDQSGTLAKLVHYMYGVGCSLVIYNLLKKYLNREYGLIGVLAFVSTLLVGWEMGSAYVDLAWTFYLTLLIYYLDKYFDSHQRVHLLAMGIFAGLSIGVKLPAIIPVVVIGLILLLATSLRQSLVYLITCFIVSLPWLMFSYWYTGNPIYPLLTNIYPSENIVIGINLLDFLSVSWKNLTWPQDPLSIFIGFIGCAFIFKLSRKNITVNKPPKDKSLGPVLYRTGLFRSEPRCNTGIDSSVFIHGLIAHGSQHSWNSSIKLKWLTLYLIANYFGWYVFFRTSGNRFLLYLLPVWLIVCLVRWRVLHHAYYSIIFSVLIFSSVVNLFYRIISVSRVVPVLVGKQSRQDYLLKRLNYNFGDFYDVDNRIGGIVGGSKVLVFGYHNLFYANFNFIHESTVVDHYNYRYWLTDKPVENCPQCSLIYRQSQTNAYLYSVNGFDKI